VNTTTGFGVRSSPSCIDGVTGGFYNKMETIRRQAYGFRNFENHRQRLQMLCG